jgi:glucose/mannose-6-phosphate isomerase
MHGTIPVIYSSSHLEAVNLRWRGQISENAKQLAYGNVLPEMNHNEIVGWRSLPHLMKALSVVFLQDRETHRRIRFRELFTQEKLRHMASSVSVVESIGRSRLARTFSLVHTGDWVSFYLAVLNKENPTPVRVIDELKDKLRTV